MREGNKTRNERGELLVADGANQGEAGRRRGSLQRRRAKRNKVR